MLRSLNQTPLYFHYIHPLGRNLFTHTFVVLWLSLAFAVMNCSTNPGLLSSEWFDGQVVDWYCTHMIFWCTTLKCWCSTLYQHNCHHNTMCYWHHIVLHNFFPRSCLSRRLWNMSAQWRNSTPCVACVSREWPMRLTTGITWSVNTSWPTVADVASTEEA